MMNLYRIFSYFTAAAAVLLFPAGCSSRPRPDAQTTQIKVSRSDLNTAIKTAVRHSLEMRVLESLQLIAKEHVEKSRLLELPGMIYDLPRRLPGLSVANDYRLSTLEHAIESCRILTTPAKSDFSKVQAEVEKRKIVLEQSIRWAKLDYVNNMKKAGINTPDVKNMEQDIILEQEISSGIPEKMIRNFDFSTLPQPAEISVAPTPEYIKKILKKYDSSPDAALRFADIVYRLPTELLHRNDSNFSAAFQLVQAVGTAIKQEIIQNYAKAALLNFRKAQVQLAQTQIKSPALYAEYEQARLAWRIAFFRHQYNRNAYPATPDKKEMTFLTDLISLQGK